MIQLGETNIRYMSRRDEFSGSKQERRVSGGGGKKQNGKELSPCRETGPDL